MVDLKSIHAFLKDSYIGQRGYLQLIDDDGIMISHPKLDHVGRDVMATRKEAFPDHDWSDMEDIVKRMCNGQEGIGTYHSAWWIDEKPAIVKKLTAFAPVRIENELWSVGIVYAYDEVSGPIMAYQRNVSIAAGLLLLFIGGAGLWFYRVQTEKTKLTVKAESAEKLHEVNQQLNLEITERKQVEKRVQKENAKLATMIFGMDEGVVFADASNLCIEVNDYFCKLTKTPREKILGKTIESIHQGNVLEHINKLIEKFRQNPDSEHVIIQRQLGGAEVMLRIQPIYRENHYDGVIFNVVDVTELVVARRESEAAKKKAIEANQAKSEFLANMSHEIRTPLNVVTGMGQLLADTPLDNLQQDYLTKINRSSNLLLNVINDVLDVSRIEAGKLELDPQPFNLSDVINDMRMMFSSSAQQKGLELTLKTDVNLPRALVGDSMRLRQVLINLLGNAVKFTESGHVSLHINKAAEAPASPDFCGLTFSVTDSGIGMNEEQMERLFKAFSQADSSTTRQYGGSGLGLFIGSRLVEAMGGRLEVTSAPGEGSTFFFTLELPKASDAVMHTTGKESGTVQETDSAVIPSFAGYTILLVEDNELNQEVAKALITKTRAKVIVAVNGKAALQCYEENRIDLILMDLLMPVMDGFDATAQIRRRERASDNDAHVPIIALSAAVLDTDRKKAAKAGVDSHLGKPIDPQELYAVMGHYLKRSGSISTEPASTEEAADEFPLLDGFDAARGKVSAQGKKDLYMKLLQSFYTKITGAAADFPDRISSLTFEEIHFEAHTIKGVAATVGALRIADAAAVIDRAGTEQTAPTESMVNELREALLSAKEQIAPHLLIEKSTVVVGEKEGLEAMDTLLAILRNSELPEDDLIETVVAFVKAQAGSEKADALSNSIEQFDMDVAVELLEKLKFRGHHT